MSLTDSLLKDHSDEGPLWYYKGIAERRVGWRDSSHKALETAVEQGPLETHARADLLLDGLEPVARVQRGLSKGPDDPTLKRTKTEKGRSVALLPLVVEALQCHRKRQAEDGLKYSGFGRITIWFSLLRRVLP